MHFLIRTKHTSFSLSFSVDFALNTRTTAYHFSKLNSFFRATEWRRIQDPFLHSYMLRRANISNIIRLLPSKHLYAFLFSLIFNGVFIFGMSHFIMCTTFKHQKYYIFEYEHIIRFRIADSSDSTRKTTTMMVKDTKTKRIQLSMFGIEWNSVIMIITTNQRQFEPSRRWFKV